MNTGRTLKPRIVPLCVLLIFGLLGPASASNLLVFAAASLQDALKEVGTNYSAQSGDKLLFNFAASSLLARQILEGAPADVFFSADDAKMDWVENRGLLLKGTRKPLLSNQLVVVVPRDSQLRIPSFVALKEQRIRRLALADPDAVPAGVYAKEYLQKLGIWDGVKAKVVPTENVRAALAAVESGNIEAGIVYRTDAAISRKVRAACAAPISKNPQISYPLAILKDSKQLAAARRFAAYLESAPARRIFERYGFIVLR